MPANKAGPVALVTGASSGIGAAIARRLAADGWSVVGVDRVVADAAEHLSSQSVVDLTDRAQVADLLSRTPPVQALVHAAGFMKTARLGALNPVDLEAMWAVHVAAFAQLAQGLIGGMETGGRLLAIGSRTSAGAAGKSQYAACKAAVTGLVRSFAIELAPRGITANVIAPAATSTAMLADAGRAVAPVVPPIGRFIEPEEVAAYAAFILSPAAAAVTGQELLICGGASL